MSKYKYIGEFEIKASKKMLYPYMSSASGLAQWFADDVNINEDKVYTFIWDGEESRARMVSHRTNSQVRFEFISDDEEPNYLEFKIDMNELTQEVFIRVTDFSEMDDEEELEELWESFMHNLRELVGG
ncbi:START-like domain-containing protein [Reichenbachiella ulvae]|uniref:START-like domain-containing protein n=1 Tax=Reichenbachiella ulvae TaxID=2980104 RepID=A0ABT3CPM3_9BACT|nr:START-like domain-containing protein [Reichenbachiella ulvae]MCV9385660.1 START-like domain-containing protein [Reichenbachiella ulvae]